MKERAFNKLLNSCRTKDRAALDMAKVRALSAADRHAMGMFVVKYRGPVLVELAEGMDRSWLAAMGYLHKTTNPTNPDMTFLHSAESEIR